MQVIAYIGLISLSTGVLMACKKNSPSYRPLASLRVVNAVIDGGTLKLNTNERDSVLTYNARSFSLAVMDNESTVWLWPTYGIDKPYYNNKLPTRDGDMYSLYLYGWSGSAESLLIKEQIPAQYTDSSVGIRVAHLSHGTGPVSINLNSDTAHSIINQVNYKTVSNIAKIPLPTVIPAGTTSFEIRDAAENKILATYTLPNSVNSQYPGISIPLQRFKNITLVLKGSRDTLSGPNAFGVFPAAVSY